MKNLASSLSLFSLILEQIFFTLFNDKFEIFLFTIYLPREKKQRKKNREKRRTEK